MKNKPGSGTGLDRNTPKRAANLPVSRDMVMGRIENSEGAGDGKCRMEAESAPAPNAVVAQQIHDIVRILEDRWGREYAPKMEGLRAQPPPSTNMADPTQATLSASEVGHTEAVCHPGDMESHKGPYPRSENGPPVRLRGPRGNSPDEKMGKPRDPRAGKTHGKRHIMRNPKGLNLDVADNPGLATNILPQGRLVVSRRDEDPYVSMDAASMDEYLRPGMSKKAIMPPLATGGHKGPDGRPQERRYDSARRT